MILEEDRRHYLLPKTTKVFMSVRMWVRVTLNLVAHGGKPQLKPRFYFSVRLNRFLCVVRPHVNLEKHLSPPEIAARAPH